jgi:hypothetical protein
VDLQCAAERSTVADDELVELRAWAWTTEINAQGAAGGLRVAADDGQGADPIPRTDLSRANHTAGDRAGSQQITPPDLDILAHDMAAGQAQLTGRLREVSIA